MTTPRDPLRILIVAEHASECFGGEALLPLQHFRRLRSRGIEAWMVVHDRSRPELERLLNGDAGRVHYVPDSLTQWLLTRLEGRLPIRAGDVIYGQPVHLITQWRARRIIKNLIRRHRIDVVHEPAPVSPRSPSLIYGVGAPVVMGPLNGGMSYPPAFRKFERRWVAALIWLGRTLSGMVHAIIPGKQRAATVLVANDRTRRALPPGVRGKVAELVENGVDLSLFRAAPRGQTAPQPGARFVFLGRLVDWKSVDLLLEALARIPPETGVTLEIVGDGPERPALAALARRLNLDGRVTFHGFLSQEKAAERLRAADGLVLPSIFECGGAVVLEAMAVGLPVIATNWGGPADYLDETCGILVEPSSREGLVDGLRDGMARLAADPGLRRRMGAAGRERLVRAGLDWDTKVDIMLDHLREAATRGGPQPRSVTVGGPARSNGHTR